MDTGNTCTFGGGSGSAWPNPSGGVIGGSETGWQDVTQSGTFTSFTAENVSGSNTGLVTGNASAAAIRTELEAVSTVGNSYLLDGGGAGDHYTGFEIDASVVRSAAANGTQEIEAGLVLQGTAAGAGGSYYLFRTYETATGGKFITDYMGCMISKVVSGTETSIVQYITSSGSFFTLTTTNTIRMKFRSFPMRNGYTLLQAKMWNSTSSEPAWLDPRTARTSLGGSSVVVANNDAQLIAYDTTAALQPGIYGGSNGACYWGLWNGWYTTGTTYTNTWSNYTEGLLTPSDGPDFWYPGEFSRRDKTGLYVPERASRIRAFLPPWRTKPTVNSNFIPFF